jgi:diguanylate cyclase (GGDEF)-like protein/PAS domain S-box-containing protein
VSSGDVVPAELVEALLRLCQGDFGHRLPRTLARDDSDTVAFFFNAIAEELERVITTSREHESRLETTVAKLSEALTRVAAGEFADVQVERDFRGDPLDVLVYLVNNTVHELSSLLAEKEKRTEADRERLERLVVEGTRKLDVSEANFQRLFELAPLPLILFDAEDLIVQRSNARAARMFEAPESALIGRHAIDFFEDAEQRHALIATLTRTGRVQDLATHLRRVPGGTFWALVNANMMRTGAGYVCLIGFSDLTEQKQIEDQLRETATTDALTGTLTRRRLLELADHEWSRAHRYTRPVCLVLLDLDFFKSINDRFGHLVGDEALRRVGAVLRASLRREDWVGRFGGEEFAIVLPETRIEAASGSMERVRAAIEAIDLEVDDERVPLAVSAGVVAMRTGESIEDALQRADEALYEAKATGRNRVVVRSEP